MNKQIINDQKKTIYRLQNECTEKTNAIIALGEQLQAKEQECEKIKEDNATLFDKAIEARKECTDLKEQLFLLKTELEQMTALKDTYFACYHAKHEDLAKKYDELKVEKEELKKELYAKTKYIRELNSRDDFCDLDMLGY